MNIRQILISDILKSKRVLQPVRTIVEERELFFQVLSAPRQIVYYEGGLADYLDCEVSRNILDGILGIRTLDNVRYLAVLYDTLQVTEESIINWLRTI